MYVVGYIIPYNYHTGVIILVTIYNNNFLINYLVLDTFLPAILTSYPILSKSLCTFKKHVLKTMCRGITSVYISKLSSLMHGCTYYFPNEVIVFYLRMIMSQQSILF